MSRLVACACGRSPQGKPTPPVVVGARSVLRLGPCSRNHVQDGWPHGEMPFWPDLSRRMTPRIAIVGDDAVHRVEGLPGEAAPVGLTLALGRLRALGVTGLRVALPVPGHPLGLSGPPEFNARALEAEEAVLAAGAGAGAGARRCTRPGPRRATDVHVEVVWRCLPVREAPPADVPSLGEAERELAEALRDATEVLVAAGRGRAGSGGARRRWRRTGRGRSAGRRGAGAGVSAACGAGVGAGAAGRCADRYRVAGRRRRQGARRRGERVGDRGPGRGAAAGGAYGPAGAGGGVQLRGGGEGAAPRVNGNRPRRTIVWSAGPFAERGRTPLGRRSRSAPIGQPQLFEVALPKAGLSTPTTLTLLPVAFTGTCTGT